MILTDYRVDPERGFLPADDPLDALPPVFDPWERTASRLSALLTAGRLRAEVEGWPTLSTELLSNRAQKERAMLVLSMVGNAYVWGDSTPATIIPAPLALPWCAVASALGRPPIVSHASLVLQNWKRLDPRGELSLSNLATQVQMLGGMDESWFYLVTVAIEAEGAAALPLLAETTRQRVRQSTDALTSQLRRIETIVARLTPLLDRMRERCDPHIFYHRIRPFLAAWPAPGLVYEGVWDEPKVFAGGSAAQSSLLQALDAALGIAHPDERSGPFLMEMRDYMPPEHRAFVEALEATPSLRDLVSQSATRSPQLVHAYDGCVSALDRFRLAHLTMVHEYISKPAAASGEMAIGTGGTPYGQFLSQTQRETTRGRIAEAPWRPVARRCTESE